MSVICLFGAMSSSSLPGKLSFPLMIRGDNNGRMSGSCGSEYGSLALAIGGIVASSLGATLVVQLCTPSDPFGKTWRFMKQLRRQERGNLTSSSSVRSSVQSYEELHDKSSSASDRNANYSTLVNSYYDLATLFYEVGWGASFHFSTRFPFESFDEATRRHEYYLASKLNLTANSNTGSKGSNKVKVLDVGCGIGGPMRNICRFTGADVTGLTLNQYQVDRGNQLCQADAHFVDHSNHYSRLPALRCRSVQGDFMHQPFLDRTFDAAYAIEATCHAPDRVACYKEIYRVLKPGAIFACYEWCLTDKYDPKNSDHVRIKKQIEEGDGLPDIATTHHCLDALQQAGFQILEHRDCALDHYAGSQLLPSGTYSTSPQARRNNHGGKPWMQPLLPSWNPFTQRFQFNWLGLRLTKYALIVLETCRLAPKGTSRTQIMLQSGAIGLAQGGQLGIFTPMYLMVGRVPLDKP